MPSLNLTAWMSDAELAELQQQFAAVVTDPDGIYEAGDFLEWAAEALMDGWRRKPVGTLLDRAIAILGALSLDDVRTLEERAHQRRAESEVV